VQTHIRHIRISTTSFATARRAVRRNLVNCRTGVGTIQVVQLFHNRSTCNQFALPTSHVRLVTLVKCRFNASVTVIHDTTDTLQTTDADADVVTLLRDDPARSPFSPCPRSTGPRSTGRSHNVCIIALQMTNVPLVPLELRVWVRVMVGWKSVLFSTLDVSCRDPWTLGLVDPGTRGPRDSWTKTVQLINVELSACRGRRAPPTRPPNDVVHRSLYKPGMLGDASSGSPAQ